VPWTAVGADKTGPLGLPNRIDRYSCFEQEISAPYLDHAQTHFGDSSWESTTSTMKKGEPDTNGSDLNKDNIIKPTFDKLMEEDRKALEGYHKEEDEFFSSCYEVM
jgi:hypothetical protein